MEYVSEINIFGLKMMVKSGLEKIFLKSLHAQSLFRKLFCFIERWIFGKIANSVIKMYVYLLSETLSHKFHPYSILST